MDAFVLSLSEPGLQLHWHSVKPWQGNRSWTLPFCSPESNLYCVTFFFFILEKTFKQQRHRKQMFRQNRSPRLYRHILDCSGLGLSVLTLPKQTSCQRDHQERPDLRSPASMTTAVDNVMLCESALCQRQWGGMGSSYTNVGPLGATPRPWLVRYPKESLCLLFTCLTEGKCKYKISHVFSCHGVSQC